ncbi:MAG: hypothetical protein LBQ15_00635 [Clostridium sp.]|nr:hypothetical protein [Clostridium sp.]
MKTVHPIGSIPNDSEFNAYGCVCSVAVGNYSAVSGDVPCNVCAYSCDPGNQANMNANQALSQSRVTHT